MHRIWKGLLVEQHSRETRDTGSPTEAGREERSGETCSGLVLPMVGLGLKPNELRRLILTSEFVDSIVSVDVDLNG